LVLELALPDGSGHDVLEPARRGGGRTPALVVAEGIDDGAINRAFDLAARVVCKPISAARIEAFVQEVSGSERRASARALRNHVVIRWKERYDLTPSEVALLHDAVEGSTRDELAQSWRISLHTVKKHVQNMIQKTGDPSLLAAVQRALREATEE
jgi:DNA-binding NarL/FixJ family response regulator